MAQNSSKRQDRWPLGVIAYASFLMAGYFKAAPGFEAIPMDLTALLAALTLCACVWSVLNGGFRPTVGLGIMAFLFGLFAVPVLWMDWLSYTGEKVTRLFTLTMLSAVAPFFLIRSSRDVTVFLSTLAGLGLLMCAGAASTLTSGAALERLSAFGSNTIALGRAAAMALIWFALLSLEKRVPLVVTLSAAGFSAALLLCSGSRGPLLTAIGILAVLAVTMYRRQMARIAFATVLLGMLGVGFFYAGQAGADWVPRTSYLRVQSFLQGEMDTSSTGRLYLYDRAWSRIPESPLGLGWGGFGVKLGVSGGTYRDYPHNIVLEVALEAGWLVAGALVAVCLVAIGRLLALRRQWEARAILAFLLLCLANAMVSGDINDNRTLFALLGLALAVRSADREEAAGRRAKPLASRVRRPGWRCSPTSPTLSPAQQAYMSQFRRSTPKLA